MNDNLNAESCATQCKLIASYMLGGGELTALTALEKFGSLSFSRRIVDLKEEGYDIKSEYILLPNGKRVKKYWMPKEQ